MSYAFALTADGSEIEIPLRVRTGPRRVLDRLAAVLGSVRGSWPQDLRAGLPLIEWAARAPSAVEVEAFIRDQIRRTGERVDVLAVDVSRGPEVRIAVQVSIPPDDDTGAPTVATIGTEPKIGAWYVIQRAP